MSNNFVVSVDLILDKVSQVKVNLESLNRLDVIGEGSVGDLVVLLKGHEKRLRVFTLLLVSEELRIKLDVNDWGLVTIHLGKLQWESTAHLVFFWIVPSGSLSERG